MKSAKRIRRLVGAVVVGAFLFSAIFSQAEEIKFLKVKYMAAQEEMGNAVLGSSRLGWGYGQVQERLGRIIQEAGPEGKIDQTLLGKGVAEAASLKWQAGAAEKSLGSAIVKTALIVSKEAAIMGKEAVQERLGAMIQAKAKDEWIASQEAKSFAATRAAALQEEAGEAILKRARFNWAEGEVAKAVRDVQRSERVSEPIPSEVLFPLRSVTGFESEETLRTALASMEEEKGLPFTGLLPASASVVSTGITRYARVGWSGWGALASLLGFAWAMAMFSWTLIDLDRTRKAPAEKVVFRKAA